MTHKDAVNEHGGQYPSTLMYEKILVFLRANHVCFELNEHAHVHSSHDAAAVRGTKIEEAAKAIVLKTGSGKIVQCVISGHLRIDLKKLKALLGEKNVALASPQDVLHATGCTIGSVPPFGNLFTPPIDVYADEQLFAREHLVFSAGSHHHSVRMRSVDWKTLVLPVVADLSLVDLTKK